MILKPDPGNPQELYLGSLKALGIDTRAHDVRFVEDNWESPVLGAWGLGWEVRNLDDSNACLPRSRIICRIQPPTQVDSWAVVADCKGGITLDDL